MTPSDRVQQLLPYGRDFSSIFVVDKDRHYVGLVTIDAALDEIKRGAKTLDDILIRDIPTVSKTTLLRDMIQFASERRLPIPVLKDNGGLAGIVTRAALLSGLSSETEVAE